LGPGGTPLFSEFLRADEQVPGRDQNQGLHINAWRIEVAKIANPHRAGKPALAGPLLVSVKVDLATGRVILDDPTTLPAGAVTVQAVGGKALPAADAQQLAIDIFPEVRKLVVGFIPNAESLKSGTVVLAVSLPALGP
jgi:hypothetical protein